jgi:hypothetical protein
MSRLQMTRIFLNADYVAFGSRPNVTKAFQREVIQTNPNST